MIYEQNIQSLFTDDRQLIREFRCPLAKAWNHLSLTGNDYVRYCGSCSRDVLDVTTFEEKQMIALFEVDPEQCAYLDFDEALDVIKIEGEPQFYRAGCTELEYEKPVIQTARGVDAINGAIRNGHLVDIRKTDVDGAVVLTNHWVRGEDGLIRHADQYSEAGDYVTSHPQGYLSSPLSAYVIPRQLEPGTKVYLSDVIEHIVEKAHHSEYRLRSGAGIWDGESIMVDEPRVHDVVG